MRYTDFVLLATEPRMEKADGKKRLTFNLLAPGVFNVPIPCELDARAVGDLTEKAGEPDANWEDARRLGQALAAALLPPDIWNALNNKVTQAAANHEGVRLRLVMSGAELNNWPWEFVLFNRGGGESKISDFLALMPNVSLARHTPTPLPAWRVEARIPARVLVAIATPKSPQWPKLNVTAERDVVMNALAGCGQLMVDSVEHAQRSRLPQKANPAHIFHFAGHGWFEKSEMSVVPAAYEVRQAGIVLEDECGDPDPLDAELLAVQLRDAGVRVAVLGACQTAQRDDVSAWSSVAEALLKAELGAVVGMQFPILDKSATCFAERFYGALGVGLSIDEAVAAGRTAMALAGDARGWATPTLYLRSPDGVVFPEFEADRRLIGPREQQRTENATIFCRINKGKLGVLAIDDIELDNPGDAPAVSELMRNIGSAGTRMQIDVNEESGVATTVEIGAIKIRGKIHERDR